jgi:hypothetical protein
MHLGPFLQRRWRTDDVALRELQALRLAPNAASPQSRVRPFDKSLVAARPNACSRVSVLFIRTARVPAVPVALHG